MRDPSITSKPPTDSAPKPVETHSSSVSPQMPQKLNDVMERHHEHQGWRNPDGYQPSRHPGEWIRHAMTPQIVSRGFEVAAMKSEGQQGPREAPHGRTVLNSAELSLFEKIFLAHFEGGIPVMGETLKKGQFHFLPKSEKGWMEFFQRFAAFALLKTVKADTVEALVFRGLMKPDGTLTREAKGLMAQAKMVLVSDLQFQNGKTDKFARLMVGEEALIQVLSKMEPGTVVTAEVLTALLKVAGGEELPYVALSHKIVNPEMAKEDPSAATQAYRTPEQIRQTAMKEGRREVTQGMALSARTEQMMAERLDINLKSRSEISLDRRVGEVGGIPGVLVGGLLGKKKKRSSLWGGSAEDGQDASVFVPWYQHVFKPQKLQGKPRWWVPFTYVIAGSVVVIASYYAFRFWMR